MGPIAPAMKEDADIAYNNSKHGTLLIFVGIAYSCGKLINGPIIDRSNPRYCMFVYIIGSSLSVLGFSYAIQAMDSSKRYYWIVGSCMLNAFFQPG
jgi:sugar phosphate permease